MKLRKAYERPSEREGREKAEAIRRQRKLARKKAQRDGLVPAPKCRKACRTPGGTEADIDARFQTGRTVQFMPTRFQLDLSVFEMVRELPRESDEPRCRSNR